MDTKGWHIILGSNSPRRRELLSGLNIEFEVDTKNNFKESFDKGSSLEAVPQQLAAGKSHGFHRPLSGHEILITADTVVILPETQTHPAKIMGKPRDRADAIRMLRELSGREHAVVTAVTLRSVLREETLSETTRVRFRELTDEEITYYVDHYKPYDKAGAYGIQEWIGHIGISGICGSYFNVVGFPVHRVYEALLHFINLNDHDTTGTENHCQSF